jgi:hypothetical protein
MTIAQPCDWGPNKDTGRLIDASKAVLEALELETDDIVEVILVKPNHIDAVI